MAGGFVYVAEKPGYLHCLDAKTGTRVYEHDLKSPIAGSAYYVDRKVYVATEDGQITIFQAGKECKIVNKVDMGAPVHSNPVVANGVLYITANSKLFAIAAK